ncbi:MAG: hypothetical protein JXA71_14470 [Chitinispirillaceae bacterium]|nr:hypothetical protein [Chitinispirillaceae bacterium]
MAERSWEEHAHRGNRTWKWLLILLPVVLVAGISIYNNRDVIYEVSGFRKNLDTAAAFAVSAAETPAQTAVKPGEAEKDVAPGRTAVAVPKGPPPGKKGPFVKDADSSTRSSSSVAAGDSVEIGEIPCRVLNRDDIVMMISLVVFCDRQARRTVLVRRDAIGVLVQNALRALDLETVKLDALKLDLLEAMNRLFDTKTITGISFRSVRIEKVSSE